jgi:hypothetical protein
LIVLPNIFATPIPIITIPRKANRGLYENAIKANEYWFKALWEPWFRAAVETKRNAE